MISGNADNILRKVGVLADSVGGERRNNPITGLIVNSDQTHVVLAQGCLSHDIRAMR